MGSSRAWDSASALGSPAIGVFTIGGGGRGGDAVGGAGGAADALVAATALVAGSMGDAAARGGLAAPGEQLADSARARGRDASTAS